MPKHLYQFILDELSISGLKPSDLRKKKNKDLNYSFARRAMERFIQSDYNGGSQEKALKELRKGLQGTGVKFSNNLGRKEFKEFRQLRPKLGYATRLKLGDLPDNELIPKIDYDIPDLFLYGFKIYVVDKGSSSKGRYPPKNNATVIVRGGKYNKIDDFVFFSEVKLNKRDALAVMGVYLSGQLNDLGTLRSYIEGSDYKSVLKNKSYDIIAYRYDRLART